MSDRVILLVEDNADDEELTRRAFKKNNISNEIVVAHDGVEAIELLMAKGSRAGSPAVTPEIVLLDLNLPRMDGLAVLREIRAEERTKLLPVIVLTSSNEERDLVESYRLGCNSYIRKPVDFPQFIEAVRQLGLYWLVLNQQPHRARS
jgi:two-component system, response regulator